MKKTLQPDMLPLLTLAAGIIGLLLRVWLLVGGTDEKGLMITGHISNIFLSILTLFVLAALFCFTRQLTGGKHYRRNFPASLPGCIGAGVGALGIFISAILNLGTGSTLSIITGLIGLLAAASLSLLSYGRFLGRQPSPFLGACVCIYMMLLLVCQYRIWSGAPQIQTYCFPLLAIVCTMIASYHSASFAQNKGIRSDHTFFHLAAVFFCCLSLVGDYTPFFFLTIGIWMYTDNCRLLPMPNQFGQENAS